MNTSKSNRFLFVSVVLYTLPFYLLSLRCFLHNDDLMNLYLYVFQPFENHLTSNIFFWSTSYRPLGGILYATLFHLFGMDPLPYYIAGYVIRIVNLGLLFFLLVRITDGPYLSVITVVLTAVHWETSDAIYNFGAVYELLAFSFFLVTFHFYISFRKSLQNRISLYIASLLAYICALNAKEMAITAPVIFAVYEIIYKPAISNLRKKIFGLVPFFAVAAIYSFGKLFGENAYLTDPAYKYVFDAEILRNLEGYIERIFYNRVNLDAIQTVLLLLASLGLATLLRNKEMLLGWFYFVITLLPVIGLRRVWGLYLYIPMTGIALYGTSLLFELGRRLIKKPIPGPLANAAIVLLFTAMILIQYPTFKIAAEKYFINPGNMKRNFQNQLLHAYPTVSSSTAFAFKDAPFIGYSLHFMVWLTYRDPSIQVFRLPEQNNAFLKARQNVESHVFEYKNSKLVELPR